MQPARVLHLIAAFALLGLAVYIGGEMIGQLQKHVKDLRPAPL